MGEPTCQHGLADRPVAVGSHERSVLAPNRLNAFLDAIKFGCGHRGKTLLARLGHLSCQNQLLMASIEAFDATCDRACYIQIRLSISRSM